MGIKWTDINASWSIKDIGGFLIRSIANDLYGPHEVIREYVQNAVDAYTRYEKVVGLQPKRTVQLRIDQDNKSVVIFDNGIGMGRSDIEQAKSIAVSPKLEDNDDYAGFRGIGLWSGLAACERLEVISTKVKDPSRYKLTINCKEIVENCGLPINIGELMEGRFKIEESDAEPGDHYTYVKLVNVNETNASMLDVASVTQYASQNLPVEIDPDWIFVNDLSEILNEIAYTTSYRLTVNGDPVYREFPKEVSKPEKEVIKTEGGKSVAVGWSCRTKISGSIPTKRNTNEVTAFSTRIKGFVIGDRGLYAPGQQKNLINWFVGEIFIIDPIIKPDTNRQRFNPDEHGIAAANAIESFYTSIISRSRSWSSELNAQKTCEEAASLVAQLTDLLDKDAGLVHISPLKHTLKDIEEKVRRYHGQASSTAKTPQLDEEQQALRKPKIKNALNQAVAQIAAVNERIDAYHFELSPPPAASSSQAGNAKPRGRSSSRTANSTGRQITLNEATTLTTLTASDGGLSVLEPMSKKVDMDKLMGAFKAVVAAVLGENSESYRQVFQRLDAELIRRGITDEN